MKNSCSFIVIFILSISSLVSQWSAPVFSIKPNDVNYLRYFYYRNNFDSALVSYTFGEVRVFSGNLWNRVYLSSALALNSQVQGEEGQGENTELLQYSRTQNFIMPDSGQISFFRHLAVSPSPCGIIVEDDGNPGGNGDGMGHLWLVGRNRISDKTEFVLRLIRASDGAVLAVLDSVGVNPNPLSSYAPYYGTTPNNMKTVRSLPQGYGNTEVYLQVSPRRYGPTPYGIDMKMYSSWLGFSTIFEFDTIQGIGLSNLQYKQLHQQYFAGILSYFDSVKAATGHLPSESLGLNLGTDSIAQIFSDRYYDKHIEANGRVYYTEKNSGFSKNASEQSSAPQSKNGIICVGNLCKLKSAEIQLVRPNPTAGNTEISITAYKEIPNVTLDIYTVSGQKIGRVWSGTLNQGKNFISINVSDYSNGTYGVYCNNQSDETMDFDKITIEK
ncbi:MAG: T9SS type A sorting domain-containing protein [Bacteroidetes bacterium]|nr:T9SS type A sorting domain-containing protein [Bacteroidota bacterium]